MSEKVARRAVVPEAYAHNTSHKEIMRSIWVARMQTIEPVKPDEGIGIITLPSDEMQDIHCFAENGLLDLEPCEAEGSYYVKNCNLICFERDHDKYRNLHAKLPRTNVFEDMKDTLITQYQQHKRGKRTYFPVDVVNLDFENSISRTGIFEILDLIFEFQARFGADFYLFLTFPQVEIENADEFKKQLIRLIELNLADEKNTEFSKIFRKKYKTMDEIPNLDFLTRSVTKMIIKDAITYNYKIDTNEFYVYGNYGHQEMVSIILKFTYLNDPLLAPPGLYYTEVVKIFKEITRIKD